MEKNLSSITLTSGDKKKFDFGTRGYDWNFFLNLTIVCKFSWTTINVEIWKRYRMYKEKEPDDIWTCLRGITRKAGIAVKVWFLCTRG